jgi:O-methyltransferase involved in polyketide biosynthesis
MDDLPDVLDEAGLDRDRPVFTIWEGVTMYLTDGAIDASLRAVRAWSPARSRLAMTYFAKELITRPSLVTRMLKAVVATFGEPWRFGWNPADLPAYLAHRGFTLERDVSIAQAARELLPPAYASLVADESRRFALAAPEAIGLAS